MSTELYTSPLVERFATREMAEIWSSQRKFSTWRRCWLALAEAQQELGLNISDEQIAELKAHLDDIDFDAVQIYEKQTRHDVMAHIHALGDIAPKAKPIIHLGATSCFVGDNTDLILIRASMKLVLSKAIAVLRHLKSFALKWKDLPTLGYTHYQPAQVVTVGKRTCLWAQDILFDIENLEQTLLRIRCRGVKGTTGTQASFLALFDDDSEKVRALDQLVAKKLGFDSSFPVTGQTYPRKVDTMILQVLAGIGESVHKFATDMRLLQNMKEIEEPFESTQVGSSAMAYKRNPMRSERACALARFLMVQPLHGSLTTAVQWFERTLDDSAIRRLSLPEAFLAADAILNLYLNIMENPVVYPNVIKKHLWAELPFMATENIIMAGVRRGGDRQVLHEAIRKHSIAAADRVKNEGADNDLLSRLAEDPEINMNIHELESTLDVNAFVGRAPAQVDEFVAEHIEPVLTRHAAQSVIKSDVRV